MVGFRPEVGVRVRLHEPRSSEKMMMWALGVEGCLLVENEVPGGAQERAAYTSCYSNSRVNYVGRGDNSKQSGVISSKTKVAPAYEKQTMTYDQLRKTLAQPNKNTIVD